MIEFEDITLVEADGHYDKVVEIMKNDNVTTPWMLRSKVYVHTDSITGVFIVHLWADRRFVIDEIQRPVSVNVPNDDIIEMSEWTREHGWLLPEPANKLLDIPRFFDFWERQYQSGLITCTFIEEREADLIRKLSNSENEENNDA